MKLYTIYKTTKNNNTKFSRAFGKFWRKNKGPANFIGSSGNKIFHFVNRIKVKKLFSEAKRQLFLV